VKVFPCSVGVTTAVGPRVETAKVVEPRVRFAAATRADWPAVDSA
jgi:hypothetical protein